MEGSTQCRKQDGEQLDLQPQQFDGDGFSGEASTSQMLEAIFQESPDGKYATLMQGFASLATESEEISVVSKDQENSFAATSKDDNLAIANSWTEIILPVSSSTSISEKDSHDQMNSETLVSNENENLTFNKGGFEDIEIKRKNSSFHCSSLEEERLPSMKDSKMKPENCKLLAEDQSIRKTPYSPTVTATCITENGRQQVHINVFAKESAVVNVEAKHCSAAVVGDGSKVNIFQGNCCGRRRQSATLSPNEALEFDGPCLTVAKEENLKKVRKRHKVKKKLRVKESHSDSNSKPENTLKQKTKIEYRFESVLSEFVDPAAVETNVIQWVGNLVSYLLRSALDLQMEDVKIVVEEAKAIRADVPNCIQKVNEAIKLMQLEGCEFLVAVTVLPELQFALAEFYSSRADYNSALGCLKKLEESGHCKDTEKSRLYVKIAKLIENAPYARCEVSTEISESGNGALLDSFDAAKRYFQKALEWNDKEPSKEERLKIQRCCYLGMAALQMRISELQRGEPSDLKDLEKARHNLELLEKIFCGITADMKCQFYMLEAYLRYFKRDFRMAASRANDAMELAQENCFSEAWDCVGFKKLGLLSELLRSCSSGFQGHLPVHGVEETLADDEDSGGNDDLESLISSDSDDS